MKDMIYSHDIDCGKKLKPCPFCGGKARITLWYGYSPSFDDYSINTYRCGCDNCEIYFEIPWDSEQAIHKWEERVS